MMQKEFIGKEAQIKYAGKVFTGTIINETKNTITIETKTKTVTIIKQNSQITINDKKINGKKIAKRPEERIKESRSHNAYT